MSDRKYGQRGYQDSDRKESRKPQQGPPPPKKEGPRGRGLGAPKTEVFRCRDCGTERPIAAVVVNDSTCHHCGRPLHNCVNCAYFDTSARNECRKDIPMRLPSKTKANTCELYAQKITVENDGGRSDSPKDPRAAFDALFK